MKKKMLGCLLAASCVTAPIAGAMIAPSPALAAEANAVTVSDEAGLRSALEGASTIETSPTKITLSADIPLTSQLAVKAGTFVEIDGNNHTISRSDDLDLSTSTGNALMSIDGGLMLENVAIDANGAGQNIARVVRVGGNGSLVINDRAKLTGGHTVSNGGACILIDHSSKGTVVMNGGEITGNSSEACTSVVAYVGGDSFTMNGGKIHKNTSGSTGTSLSGMIAIDSVGKIFLNGGEITDNTVGKAGIGVITTTFNAKPNDQGAHKVALKSEFKIYGNKTTGGIVSDLSLRENDGDYTNNGSLPWTRLSNAYRLAGALNNDITVTVMQSEHNSTDANYVIPRRTLFQSDGTYMPTEKDLKHVKVVAVFKDGKTKDLTGSGEDAEKYRLTIVNGRIELFAKTDLTLHVSGDPDAETKTLEAEYGSAVQLSDSLLSRKGYRLTSWNTDADGTGTRYEPNYRFTGWYVNDKGEDATYPTTGGKKENVLAKPLDLYGQWEPMTYKINYKLFDGELQEGANAPSEFTYNKDASIPAPERDGFEFAGWYTDSSFNNALEENGDGTYKLPANTYASAVTLYAKWVAKTDSNTVTWFVNPVIEGQKYTGSKIEPEVQVYKNGNAALENEYEIVYESNVNVSDSPAMVTVKVGETVVGTAEFNIVPARTELTVTANSKSELELSGASTVKIDVSGKIAGTETPLPDDAAFTVECGSDDATKNADGTWTLPNKTATYVFTATYAGDSNHEGSTAECTVNVTYSAPVIVNPSRPVDVPSVEGGSVSVNPSSAKAGDVVTATVAADSAHRVYALRVVDAKGAEVAVSAGEAAGEFTFIMPDSEVTATPVFAKNFADADYGAWYASSLDLVSARGIMNGIGGTNDFGVGKTLTRAELAALLYNYAVPGHSSEIADANTTGMSDVEGSQWYTSAANWAVANGVINGKVEADGSRTFDPSGEVTLEQLVAVLQNLTHGTGSVSLSKFGDASSVSSWAEGAVSWAVSVGLVNGSDEADGVYLRSGADMARERVAAVIANAFRQSVLK